MALPVRDPDQEKEPREVQLLRQFAEMRDHPTEAFTPYPTEAEVQARMAAEDARRGDREYEDDDRDYIDELNALGHGPLYLAEDFD